MNSQPDTPQVLTMPCADGSVRPWVWVDPRTGRTIARLRSRSEAEDYAEERDMLDCDLYRNGVLVRAALEYEAGPCDGPSDADPGL